jgi:two-component system, sensor histidine kinase and response regulator
MTQPSVRVLLVEDDEDDYILTRDLLASSDAPGLTLDWLTTYEAARAAMTSGSYDVYLVDYHLGAHSGLELLREAAARGCDAPIIVLTGQGNREIDLQVMQAGATSYLAKGEITAPLLERTIRYALELRRAQRTVRELQQRAQQRERLADIGAIAAQIVHDIGNPLSAISMQTQLLLRRANQDGTRLLTSARETLEHILHEVHRLDLLVKGFLEFGREQRLERKIVDLRRFLEEVVGLWQPVAASRQIALTLEEADELPRIEADEDKLRRVLENLVKNAAEAIVQGPGLIHIRALLTTPARIRISVEDSGPGIAPNIQPFRLFETTKPSGTGLGLSIAQQIVSAHGGNIDFTARQPHGTVFHVDLPVGASRR